MRHNIASTPNLECWNTMIFVAMRCLLNVKLPFLRKVVREHALINLLVLHRYWNSIGSQGKLSHLYRTITIHLKNVKPYLLSLYINNRKTIHDYNFFVRVDIVFRQVNNSNFCWLTLLFNVSVITLIKKR